MTAVRPVGPVVSIVVLAMLVLVSCGGSVGESSDRAPAFPTTPDATATPTLHELQPTPRPAYPANALEGIVIALDAGHGGGDKGASGYCTGTEVTEADVNLRTREMLVEHLKSVGATVFLVPRLADQEARVRAAEHAGAEILISIHHNGYRDAGENYTMTYISDDTDLALALFVHPQLVEALALPDSEIQYDEFGVTSNGDIPAILTEASFITNSVEACNFLSNQSRIRAEARALFYGIMDYFENR